MQDNHPLGPIEYDEAAVLDEVNNRGLDEATRKLPQPTKDFQHFVDAMNVKHDITLDKYTKPPTGYLFGEDVS